MYSLYSTSSQLANLTLAIWVTICACAVRDMDCFSLNHTVGLLSVSIMRFDKVKLQNMCNFL